MGHGWMSKDVLGYKDKFGNIISPYNKWRKGKSPRCPKGHAYCDDECRPARRDMKRRAIEDQT